MKKSKLSESQIVAMLNGGLQNNTYNDFILEILTLPKISILGKIKAQVHYVNRDEQVV